MGFMDQLRGMVMLTVLWWKHFRMHSGRRGRKQSNQHIR